MEKTATLYLRVNPTVKKRADDIRAKLDKGYRDAISGNVKDAKEALDALRKGHK